MVLNHIVSFSYVLPVILALCLGLSKAQGNGDPSFFINFDIPNGIASCGSAVISYTFSPSIDSSVSSATVLTLVVDSGESSVFSTLTNAATLDGSWEWNPVNVPAGSYQLVGNQAAGNILMGGQSNSFNVSQGISTACLSKDAGSSAADSSSTPTFTLLSSVGSSAVASSSATASSSSSDVNPTSPTTATTSKHKVLGLAVGLTLIGLLILFAALFTTLRSRLRRSGSRPRTIMPYHNLGIDRRHSSFRRQKSVQPHIESIISASGPYNSQQSIIGRGRSAYPESAASSDSSHTMVENQSNRTFIIDPFSDSHRTSSIISMMESAENSEVTHDGLLSGSGDGSLVSRLPAARVSSPTLDA